jgi:hypothetical protein
VEIGSSCAAVTGYNFPLGQSPKNFEGEGGKKVGCRTGIRSQEPEYLSGPPHSAVAAIGDRGRRDHRSRLNRKNFFAKRRMRAGRCDAANRGLTSPTLGVGGNLLCRIVQFGWFRGAHPSRMLASASRDRGLPLRDAPIAIALYERLFGRDAEISTRDACTTQSSSPRYSSSRRSFALDRKLRRLLRRVKRKLSKWLSRQHVLIFRSINHRRA